MTPVYLGGLSRLTTSILNAALTITLEQVPPLWHGPGMATRTTMAGGCFLTIGLLAGFVAGIVLHNPMKGVLLGFAAGAVLALAVWLIDRWRG